MIDKNLFLYDLAVAAIFKDEARYLKEWLDYHLLAGVEHFYLYFSSKYCPKLLSAPSRFVKEFLKSPWKKFFRPSKNFSDIDLIFILLWRYNTIKNFYA